MSEYNLFKNTAHSDILFSTTQLLADTDFVIFRFKAKVTHNGTLVGIPSTGKRVTGTGVVIYKVDNG